MNERPALIHGAEVTCNGSVVAAMPFYGKNSATVVSGKGEASAIKAVPWVLDRYLPS